VVTVGNRSAWEKASRKHVDEYQELLDEARNSSSLFECELALLRPLLASNPGVVHLQSGHGLDDVALVAEGARSVVGVDFSSVAATAAQRRATELGVNCRYVIAELPGAPLRDGCTELVYTGKGALIWLPDLDSWAADVARLLTPGGHLFVHEAHPMVPLWTWDTRRAADPAGPRVFRAVARQRHVPCQRGGGVAGDAGRDRHRGARCRAGTAAPGRAPGTVLALG
jgi:SAM-dependent methyltransferase